MNPARKTLSNSIDAKVNQNYHEVEKQHSVVENISTQELITEQRLAFPLSILRKKNTCFEQAISPAEMIH